MRIPCSFAACNAVDKFKDEDHVHIGDLITVTIADVVSVTNSTHFLLREDKKAQKNRADKTTLSFLGNQGALVEVSVVAPTLTLKLTAASSTIVPPMRLEDGALVVTIKINKTPGQATAGRRVELCVRIFAADGARECLGMAAAPVQLRGHNPKAGAGVRNSRKRKGLSADDAHDGSDGNGDGGVRSGKEKKAKLVATTAKTTKAATAATMHTAARAIGLFLPCGESGPALEDGRRAALFIGDRSDDCGAATVESDYESLLASIDACFFLVYGA